MRSNSSVPLPAAAIAAVLMIAGACSTAPAVRHNSWSLRHVSVVDVGTGQILPDQTVVISGDRIAAVGATRPGDVPLGTAIDAGGRYLLPGLWDMHAHLWDHDVTPTLFLANGVTGIRDMGSDTTASVALREDVRRGRRMAPRVITAGAVLDGPRTDPAPHRLTITSTTEVVPTVAASAAAGVDFLKVYHFLSRDVYLEIASEARKHGLPIAGHLPANVTIDDAVAAGQRSIEHLYGIREQILRGDEAAIDEAARRSARGGVWHTPTLAHYRSVAFRDSANSPYVPDVHERFLTPAMRQFWDTYMPRRQRSADQERELSAGFARFQSGVQRMHSLGVRILAGSDNGIKYVYPGFGLHDELSELVAAGLSPLDALRAATVSATEYLNLASQVGTIRVNMIADLVLLNGDPLRDIRHTRHIEAVVANGVYLSRASLDRMLDAAASR